MDANGLSVLWYMRSKPVGKVRRRVQDLRNPASSSSVLFTSKPVVDLSHNESVRLAADALLSQGSVGYRDMLTAEGEVDFLSAQEKSYILENGRDANTADNDDDDEEDGGSDEGEEVERLSAGSQSLTRCPAESTDSDPSEPGLDLNWPNGVDWRQPELGPPSAEVYFQSGNRAACIKDLVREFMRKATKVLAIVMDTFSDVELLCDLLEASKKRSVSVYLLLDHLNLKTFLSMCEDLNISSQHLTKLWVRSVEGQTYCAKTGRRLTGQIAESFIITDWTEVLGGSYSFSWLSWQVHRTLAVLFKGGAVAPFCLEFRRLYASSKPIPSLLPPPHLYNLPLTSHLTQNRTSGISSARTKPNRTVGNRTKTEQRRNPFESQDTRTDARVPAGDMQWISCLSKPQLTDLERDRTDVHLSSEHHTKTHLKSMVHVQIQTQMDLKPLIQITDSLCGISSLGTEQRVPAESPEHNMHGLSSHQTQTLVKPQIQTNVQTQPHSNPLIQAQVLVDSSGICTTLRAEQGVGDQKSQSQPPKSQSATTAQTHRLDRTESKTQDINSLSILKIHSKPPDPTQPNVGTVGQFSLDKSKNTESTMGNEITEGLNRLRGQQNDPLTLISKSERRPTDSLGLFIPRWKETQAQAENSHPYLGLFTTRRNQTPGADTRMSPPGLGAMSQTQPQTQLQLQTHAQPRAESPDSPGMGTKPQSCPQHQLDFKLSSHGVGSKSQTQPLPWSQHQPQPESKWSSPGMGTNPQPQPQPQHHTSQLCTPPRLYWIPKRHASNIQPVVHQRSFSSTYGTGGQLGWRTFQNNVVTPLARTNSLLDTHSSLVKEPVLNPHINNRVAPS